MKITNFQTRLTKILGITGRKRAKRLAAAVVTGGLMFSGATTDAANLIENNGFEIADGDPGSAWVNQGGNYTHPYGGISGPQLTEIGTLNNYGFSDSLSGDAGTSFHGLSFPTTQTVSLVNTDLSAGEILSGEGRFEFSSWLATCCNDVPKVTATFNNSASTTISLNRGIADNMVTTADVLVNPGGANNAESLGVETDANRRYWALYEFRGVIPADATEVTIAVDDGRADAEAAGSSVGGNGNDNYADIMFFDAVQSTEALSLELQVNKATGAMTIINNSPRAEDINFYEIESTGGSGTLNSSWSGLGNIDAVEDPNGATPGSGNDPTEVWTKAGGSNSNLLSEAFLLGSTDFAIGGDSESMTNGYTGGNGGAEDLIFRYGLSSGALLTGVVSYVTGASIDGDYNGNGVVDAADYTIWRDTLGSTSDLRADGDGNGTVQTADYAFWKSRFGNTSGSGSAVPEPSSLLLLGGLGTLLLFSGSRRNDA